MGLCQGRQRQDLGPPGTLTGESALERGLGQGGQPCPEVKVGAEAGWRMGAPGVPQHQVCAWVAGAPRVGRTAGSGAGSQEDSVSAPATGRKLTETDSNANVKPTL